jgi:hypothetical protein
MKSKKSFSSLDLQKIFMNLQYKLLKTPDHAAAFWAVKILAMSLGGHPNPSVPFSTQVEGGVFAAICLRNSPLEDYVAIDNEAMKQINIWTSRAMTGVITLRNICMEMGEEGNQYWRLMICAYYDLYCSGWDNAHAAPEESESFSD